MALPEFVTPVIAVVGTPALAYIATRSLWLFVRAIMVLVACSVAMKKTTNADQRKSCLTIVDKLTGHNRPHRALQPPRRRGIGR